MTLFDLILIFLLLLLLSFAAAALALRPSRQEAELLRQLERIGQVPNAAAAEQTILKPPALSSLPWLHNLMSPWPGIYRLQLLLGQAGAGPRWTVAAVVFASGAGAFLLALLLHALGWGAVALVGLPVGAGLPTLALVVLRYRRFQALDAQLPETIDLLSRALKAGHAVTAAIEMVAEELPPPIGGEFRTLFKQQALGLPLREGLRHLLARVPIDDVRFLVAAILIQRETGGNLAEILDNTAHLMRQRIRLRGQLRIYSAQGRLTGWILCLLPFVLFLMLDAVNPGYEHELLSVPLGRHLVILALVMMALGVMVMRKILKIRV